MCSSDLTPTTPRHSPESGIISRCGLSIPGNCDTATWLVILPISTMWTDVIPTPAPTWKRAGRPYLQPVTRLMERWRFLPMDAGPIPPGVSTCGRMPNSRWISVARLILTPLYCTPALIFPMTTGGFAARSSFRMARKKRYR